MVDNEDVDRARSRPSDLPAIAYTDEEIRKWREAMIDIHAKVHDKAAAYTNLIIVAGYAGVFTIWNFTRVNLTAKGTALVAILLGVSLASFVAFEIYKMFYGANNSGAQRNLLIRNPPIPTMLNELTELQARAQEATLRELVPVWRFSLILAIFPAVCAGLLLFYSFLATLFSWQQWP